MSAGAVIGSAARAAGVRLAVVAIWLLTAAVLLWTARDIIAAQNFRDSDDALRLVQVRDWLAGQSWFDVTQYRVHPPAGVPMHWSRLVDLPIGGFILLYGLVLPPGWAERAACATVPMLCHLGLFLSLDLLTRRASGDPRLSVLAAVMLAMAMGVTLQFLPMRIDHHGWQILLGVLAAALVLGARARRRGEAMLAGIVMALSLTIALEGLPVAVALAGVLALGYLLGRDNGRPLSDYLLGLTAGCALLGVATQGWTRAQILWCDAMSPAYLLPMATATAVFVASGRMVAPTGRRAAFARLILAAGAGAASFVLHSPQCAAGPFSRMDPVVYSQWYSAIGEGMPVWSQPMDIGLVVLVPGLIGLAGALAAFAGSHAVERREAWGALILLQLAALLVSATVVRAMGLSHVLALPGAAWLFVKLFRTAMRLPRPLLRVPVAVATVVFTPLGAVSATHAMFVPPVKAPSHGSNARLSCSTYAGTRSLDALPPTLLFSPIDIGSHLVAYTHHSVVATGHHRNQAGIKAVIQAFTADPEGARGIVVATRARYLPLCVDENEVRKMVKTNPHGLMAALVADRPPSWLRPVPMPKGQVLRLYEIR